MKTETRLYSFLLTLFMLTVILAGSVISAQAAGQPILHTLSIGEEQYSGSQLQNGYCTSDWEWDEQHATLTLTDLNLSGSSSAIILEAASPATEICIRSSGNCTITADTGIEANCGLSFAGGREASLTIHAAETGISTAGPCRFRSGTYTICVSSQEKSLISGIDCRFPETSSISDAVSIGTSTCLNMQVTSSCPDGQAAAVLLDRSRFTAKYLGTGQIDLQISGENGCSAAVVLDEKTGETGMLEDLSNGRNKLHMESSFDSVRLRAFSPAPVFSDIPNDAYYADAAVWAVGNEITSGISDTAFQPDAFCTRAQAVTFLWRAAGKPAPQNGLSFDDVKPGSYYEQAVAWAAEQGITNGTSVSAFSPETVCTRGQIVTLLWRFAGASDSVSDCPFTDVTAENYFFQPVVWAAEQGITEGTSADRFRPDSICTRAQILTFLYRYSVG